MHTGQTLITLGALILLSLSVMNINKVMTENSDWMNKTRFGLEAVALATSIIEQASQFPFDEVSWDSTKLQKDIMDFTIANDLGPESGETDFASFDDFDDFNSYSITENTMQNSYNILCQVSYVNLMNPDNPISSRSYYKKLTVAITNPYCGETIQMSYVHGYWYFN